MKFLFPIASIVILFFISRIYPSDFLDEQLKFARVEKAESEKGLSIRNGLNDLHIKTDSLNIFIRIFKFEKIIELWVKSVDVDTFILHKKYKFCSSSGDLGPKRKQGDFQIPEGFYFIDRFNPFSKFYLSLGLNYPNDSDRILGDPNKPGGDIFIHGDCVTIGCIPVTDDKIKELYMYAVYAKSGGQSKIPVHIFPYNFTDIDIAQYILSNSKYKFNLEFWSDLKKINMIFEKSHKLPKRIMVKNSGTYVVIEN
jgi:murein L,D-transpeptidase YafK